MPDKRISSYHGIQEEQRTATDSRYGNFFLRPSDAQHGTSLANLNKTSIDFNIQRNITKKYHSLIATINVLFANWFFVFISNSLRAKFVYTFVSVY